MIREAQLHTERQSYNFSKGNHKVPRVVACYVTIRSHIGPEKLEQPVLAQAGAGNRRRSACPA